MEGRSSETSTRSGKATLTPGAANAYALGAGRRCLCRGLSVWDRRGELIALVVSPARAVVAVRAVGADFVVASRLVVGPGVAVGAGPIFVPVVALVVARAVVAAVVSVVTVVSFLLVGFVSDDRAADGADGAAEEGAFAGAAVGQSADAGAEQRPAGPAKQGAVAGVGLAAERAEADESDNERRQEFGAHGGHLARIDTVGRSRLGLAQSIAPAALTASGALGSGDGADDAGQPGGPDDVPGEDVAGPVRAQP